MCISTSDTVVNSSQGNAMFQFPIKYNNLPQSLPDTHKSPSYANLLCPRKSLRTSQISHSLPYEAKLSLTARARPAFHSIKRRHWEQGQAHSTTQNREREPIQGHDWRLQQGPWSSQAAASLLRASGPGFILKSSMFWLCHVHLAWAHSRSSKEEELYPHSNVQVRSQSWNAGGTII